MICILLPFFIIQKILPEIMHKTNKKNLNIVDGTTTITTTKTHRNEVSTMHSFIMKIFIFFSAHDFIPSTQFLWCFSLCVCVYVSFLFVIFSFHFQDLAVLCSKRDCLCLGLVFCSMLLSKSFKQICGLSLLENDVIHRISRIVLNFVCV